MADNQSMTTNTYAHTPTGESFTVTLTQTDGGWTVTVTSTWERAVLPMAPVEFPTEEMARQVANAYWKGGKTQMATTWAEYLRDASSLTWRSENNAPLRKGWR